MQKRESLFFGEKVVSLLVFWQCVSNLVFLAEHIIGISVFRHNGNHLANNGSKHRLLSGPDMIYNMLGPDVDL